VTGDDPKRAERLREIFTSLLEKRLSASLGEVEEALGRWRKGDATVFEAHATLLSHAARAERLIERLLAEGGHVQDQLLRDAFDESLVARDEFAELAGKLPESVEPSPEGSDAPMELPEKHDVLERLLDEGPVLIQLDARRPGVDVPGEFTDDARLVLRLGFGLTPPIHDLSLCDEGVSATLTFSGSPYHCVVPWHAMYAVVSTVGDRRMVWPEDIPSEALAEFSAQVGASDLVDEPVAPPPQAKRGGHLRLVK